MQLTLRILSYNHNLYSIYVMRSDSILPKKGEIINWREFLGDIQYKYVSNHKRNYLNMKCTLCWKISYVESKQVRKWFCKCTQPSRVAVKHWLSSSRFYSIYHWILSRCNNPKNIYYHIYWWKWIKCERETFEDFKADMYDDYIEHIKVFWEKNTTIDRINPLGNYCKDNCRRATINEQNFNKSITNTVTIDWKVYDWLKLSEELWISKSVACDRLSKYLSWRLSLESLMKKWYHRKLPLIVEIDWVVYTVKDIERITHLWAREARRRLSSYINWQITKEKLFTINRNYTPATA